MPIKEGIEYGVNEALTNLRSKPISTTPDLPLATRINLLKDKDPKRYQENMQRLIQAEKDGDEEARKLLGEIGEDAGRNRRGYEGLATAMTFAPVLPVAGGMAWKAMNNPVVSAGIDVATGNYGDAAIGLATDILPGKIFFNIFKTPDKISDFAADAIIDAYGYKEYLSKSNPIQNEAVERVLKFYNDPEYVKRFAKISDKSNIDKFKRAINDLIFKINYGLKNGNKKKIVGGYYGNGEVTLNPDFVDNITVNVHEVGHGSTDSGRLLPEEVLKHNSNFIPKIKPSIKKRMELNKDLYKDVMYHLEPDELRARGIEIKTLMNEYGIDVNTALQKWHDLNYGNTSLKYFNRNSLKRYVNNFLGMTPIAISMNMETKQAE